MYVALAVRLVWSASRARTLLALAVQVIASLSLFASVLLVNSLLESVLSIARDEASATQAVAPAALLALLSAMTTAAVAVSNVQQRVLGALVEREIWRDIFRVSSTVSLRSYDDPDFYDHAARVEDRAAWETRLVVQALAMLTGDLLAVVAGITALLAIAPLLTPILLLSGVPLLIASRLAGRREYSFAVEQSHPARERAYVQELLTGRDEAKEVRAFSSSEVLQQHWEKSFSGHLRNLRQHASRLTRLTVAGGIGSALVTAAALIVALGLVGRGDLGVSEAGAALIAVRLLGSRVSGASRSLSQVFESSLFLQDLMDFRDREPRSDARHSLSTAPGHFDELVVENVHFTYPDAPTPALRGASLRVRRGEVVALVGENGSGKSTLAKLLANLYEPDAGTVRWDGVDVRQFRPDTVRQHIAVLFQDFLRYRLSAHTNIALGRATEHLAQDRVVSAAVRADADAFLSALPAGYDTILSKEYLGGADLSLGQWQRVALARAFVRDAPFLILDEPSASLDARAEHDLFERLRRLFADRTVLVISHRFSTVRTADRIYVLKEGLVAEEGDHDTLMANGGLYAELFTLQARGYMDPDEVGQPDATRIPGSSGYTTNA
jgi:ATP-binding cassette subfamily B protein